MIKTTRKIKKVAFFGDADAKQNSQHYRNAFEVARLLASCGYIIVNGGGPGVMLASTLGAKQSGGQVEIVTWDRGEKSANYEGELKENADLADKKYSESNYEDRVKKLVELSDAFVIFKGGTGTLSEMGMVWGMAKLNYGHHKPVIFFGKFWKKIIKSIVNNLVIDQKEKNVYTIAWQKFKVKKILDNLSA
ncbi:hypothetical protein DRH14_00325 [Candidatus Shapirobacteria bacterium]|nr:MAG: hypothetical protein DRH14_00325 [Candidatus Shapirobacteria bacterium]